MSPASNRESQHGRVAAAQLRAIDVEHGIIYRPHPHDTLTSIPRNKNILTGIWDVFVAGRVTIYAPSSTQLRRIASDIPSQQPSSIHPASITNHPEHLQAPFLHLPFPVPFNLPSFLPSNKKELEKRTPDPYPKQPPTIQTTQAYANNHISHVFSPLHASVLQK